MEYSVKQEPVVTIKQKCAACLKGTKLIQTIVILVCTAVVAQQISACVTKLMYKPITTYTHFDFNNTILYPSVTFCREPPYKYDNMLKHNLYAHPRYTSAWADFNFSSVTLDDLWDNITYRKHEFFAQYGLDGSMDNVEVHPTTGFMKGRCHTLTPKAPMTHASRDTGYSVTLQHHAQDVATSTSVHPPGYHVYVHYSKEPFTEVEVYNGGLLDYVYIHTGETMSVKLTVNEYSKISSYDDPCTNDEEYSANRCTSQHVWNFVGNHAGCSGPWMTSDLPRCNNFSTMTNLIAAYINKYDNPTTAVCPRFCKSCLYNAFVVDRHMAYSWDSDEQLWMVRTGDVALQSQLYLFFNSMMVSVYEERYNYDWNLFLADLGGSVGFLLGLSVVGLISIVGKTWCTIVSPFIKPGNVKKDNISTTSTTLMPALSSKEQEVRQNDEMFKKCNPWSITDDLEMNKY